MMLLKDFLEISHTDFQVIVRNNNSFKKINDTEFYFYGEDTGYNFVQLQGYLYDPIIDIKTVLVGGNGKATSLLAVTVLHKDEGKEKEE